MKLQLTQNNHSIEAELISSTPFIIAINGEKHHVDLIQISDNLYSIIINNESWFLSYNEKDSQIYLSDSNQDAIITMQTELDIMLAEFGFASSEDEKAGEIHASIPGLITKLFVKVGDQIEVRYHVCVLEAMKMENEINAPISGIVKSINVSEGSSIEKGDLIMEIEPNVME